MDNKNLPAHPVNYLHDTFTGSNFNSDSDGMAGFTKRELGAFMCLQGLLPKTSADGLTQSEFNGLISDAVGLADALLTHLENT